MEPNWPYSLHEIKGRPNTKIAWKMKTFKFEQFKFLEYFSISLDEIDTKMC